MKFKDWLLVFIISCTSAAGLLFGMIPIVPETHAKSFCAYNRVFVEFREGNLIWGTILLDHNGRPIPCKENDDDVVTEPTTYNKETI